MKLPDKSKGMKKYIVLFSIVLVSIVVSVVVAGYVSTENVVKDIPTKVQNQFQMMQTNLTAIKSLLNNGILL